MAKKINCEDCGKLCFGMKCRDCRKTNSNKKRVRIKITCEMCGKTKEVEPCYKNRKYCSSKCYNASRKNRAKRNRIKITCEVCGKMKEVIPSRTKNGGGKYCSKKCAGISYKKKIKITCEVCGKIKEFKLSDIKNGGGKYCSYKCMRIAHITRVKIICKVCGEEFEVVPSDIERGGGKYCSRKCYGIASTKERIIKICETCGKIIKLRPLVIENGRGKYCSLECAGIANSGENNSNWQGGKSFEIYPKGWKQVKKEIRIRDNNRCMRCGRAREEFKRALSVHHIDADKSNINFNNLITLCDHVSGSCHGLTRGKEELFAEGFRSILKRLYGYEYE